MDQHHLLSWGNLASAAAVITTLLGVVPAIAGLVALVWYIIQISESKTVQHWMANRRVRKLARLKAKIILLEAQHQSRSLELPTDDGL